MGTEEIIIRKVEGAIRGIKLKKKKPEDTNVGYLLNKLKDLNQPMYEDKLFEYINVKNEYDKKNENG